MVNGLPRWLDGKEFACQCRRPEFQPWIRKILLEEEMATCSNLLAQKIPWTEEPGLGRGGEHSPRNWKESDRAE